MFWQTDKVVQQTVTSRYRRQRWFYKRPNYGAYWNLWNKILGVMKTVNFYQNDRVGRKQTTYHHICQNNSSVMTKPVWMAMKTEQWHLLIISLIKETINFSPFSKTLILNTWQKQQKSISCWTGELSWTGWESISSSLSYLPAKYAIFIFILTAYSSKDTNMQTLAVLVVRYTSHYKILIKKCNQLSPCPLAIPSSSSDLNPMDKKARATNVRTVGL